MKILGLENGWDNKEMRGDMLQSYLTHTMGKWAVNQWQWQQSKTFLYVYRNR